MINTLILLKILILQYVYTTYLNTQITLEQCDSSGSLYQFKRDEFPMNDSGNPINVAISNSSSLKYKSSILGKATVASGTNNADRSLKNVKIVVPLEILRNFWRSLEMAFINCKIYLELNWTKNCVMYGADTYAGGDNDNNRETTFKITSTKIVTLSTKDNVNLTKQLNEGFKIPVYCNEHRTKIETNLLFRVLQNCMFLLMITLLLLMITMVLIELKETVIENNSFQE